MVQKVQNLRASRGQRYKIVNLKSITILRCLNFINRLPVWEGKYNNATNVLCKSYLLVRPLNGAKEPNLRPKWGQKYQIVKFKASSAFEVLRTS